MLTALLTRVGLTSGLAKLISFAVVAVVCVGLYATGSRDGYGRCSAKTNLALLAKERASIAKLLKLRTENEKLSMELLRSQQHERVVYRTIREKVPHVVREIIDVPYPGGVPECRVGSDFVGLWDDATFGRVPQAATGVADGSAGAGAVEEDASSVGFTDLLSNHIDNAEIATSVRTQCSRLIAFDREHRQ